MKEDMDCVGGVLEQTKTDEDGRECAKWPKESGYPIIVYVFPSLPFLPFFFLLKYVICL